MCIRDSDTLAHAEAVDVEAIAEEASDVSAAAEASDNEEEK